MTVLDIDCIIDSSWYTMASWLTATLHGTSVGMPHQRHFALQGTGVHYHGVVLFCLPVTILLTDLDFEGEGYRDVGQETYFSH